MQNNSVKFDVNWSTSLKLITLMSVLLLGGIPLSIFYSRADPGHTMIWSFAVLPLVVLICGFFFMIRGYELTGSTLYVQRVGWQSKIELTNLTSVVVDPDAMKSSWRLFGNGGLFCFAGSFRNKKLGSYRAFATDPKSSVILTFNNRTIVVTPADPQSFASQLNRLISS